MRQSNSNQGPAHDLVNVQQKIATLDQLISNYNQLYQTYLQQVESEMNKRQQRKYPYSIKNPNEFGNPITPATPFPSNGTEDACFKSCVDNSDCVYALYSNTGCGIDCNPNKCLLYGEKADGIVPVKELQSAFPKCPVAGDADGTDAWCKVFNNPVTNAIIPALVLRKGATDWRSLAVQMPKSTANPADAQLSVDLTTDVQTWGPDIQFSDVNSAPSNEISLQFRYFAEYWLNAYGLQSGSTIVIAGQGPIGTFSFSKLNPVGTGPSAGPTSYMGAFGGQTMSWNSDAPSSGGAAAGQQTAAVIASNSESAKFNYNYSAYEKPVWKVTPNMNAMMGQIPSQAAKMSVPSWQFLGLQDSASACQAAAMNDPDHVYTTATYFNASYDNPKNGNNAFARACYGHVAGAPPSTVSTTNDDGVQSMTPPNGYTKLGGKPGIVILKKLYHLNQQIMALTNDLKVNAAPKGPAPGPKKEAFTQKKDVADSDKHMDRIERLSEKIKMDSIKLNETIAKDQDLDADEAESKQALLYSRVKFGVAIVIGLFMGYLAYRFLTADNELPQAIQDEIGAPSIPIDQSFSEMDMNPIDSVDMNPEV
jgi:uncharacterized membrane-anchored protein YhcB (DUF1043 family)